MIESICALQTYIVYLHIRTSNYEPSRAEPSRVLVVLDSYEPSIGSARLGSVKFRDTRTRLGSLRVLKLRSALGSYDTERRVSNEYSARFQPWKYSIIFSIRFDTRSSHSFINDI